MASFRLNILRLGYAAKPGNRIKGGTFENYLTLVANARSRGMGYRENENDVELIAIPARWIGVTVKVAFDGINSAKSVLLEIRNV